MRRRNPKHPIHKCGSCLFNLRTTCALFDDPKAQWDRGECQGRDNLDFLVRLEQEHPDVGATLRKRLRQIEARRRSTEDHHEGNTPHIARGVRERHRQDSSDAASRAVGKTQPGNTRSQRAARRP